MPRTTQLKDVNAGLRDGVHRMADCPFCDKKNIRSDHFPQHVNVHFKSSSATNAMDFADAYDDITVFDNVLAKTVIKNDCPRYPAGVCYDCKKVIINKQPEDESPFTEHVCKEKKEKMAKEAEEKKAKAPPDFKALWEVIGKMKMSEKMRGRYEDTEECYDEGNNEQRCNERIISFVTRVLKTEMSAAQASGTGLMTLKKHSKIGQYLTEDENEAEIISSINAAFQLSRNQAEIMEKKIQSAVMRETNSLTEELNEMTVANTGYRQDLHSLTINFNSQESELRRLRSEIAALRLQVPEVISHD